MAHVAATHGLHNLLASQDGVLRRDQALRWMSEGSLGWRLRTGRWQRPQPGVVVAHSGPLDARQQLWVDLLACGRGAVLAGVTAATLDGLRTEGDGRTYVLVPSGRQVRPLNGIHVVRSERLGSDQVHPLKLPPRTRLPRSLVDAASWAATADRARVVLCLGVQQRLVRPADLRAAVLGNTPRRRLILRTLDDVEGGAHSLPELEFAALVRRHRLPEPSRQVVRRDRDGRRRYLDVCFDDYGVVVEIDGFWHMDALPWWQDMARGNGHVVAGERLLRYPSFVVREQPALVARQVLEVLRAAGYPG